MALTLAALSPAQTLSPEAQANAIRQIEALSALKKLRTPAQRKISSQLLVKRDMLSGKRMLTASYGLLNDIQPERDGRVFVDIRANVTSRLLAKIAACGGTVRSSVPEFDSITAVVPFGQLETLAADQDVRFINRQQPKTTHVLTSEGDVAHGANLARSVYGLNGTGVKIGVLSDGVMSLNASKASGELPTVQVISGQAGPSDGDEGTAMLEIVHDLAPGASLAFATAYDTPAQFAANILSLKSAGCKVIVDDVMYLTEPCFQDGPIAKAINQCAAANVLYFSAIGNEGRLSANTSGVWEGDWKDSGSGFSDNSAKFLAFDGSTTWYNLVPDDGNGGYGAYASLQWSDQLGHSANDYDLYVVNSSGSVVNSSDNVQDGNDDPVEMCVTASGYYMVVAKVTAGAARFIHTNVFRGTLNWATNGDAFGHATTTGAFGIAASSAYKKTVKFTTSSPVEYFSSNGPRRMFYKPDGTAYTPGNFLKTGGTLFKKPDFTAADGVVTSVSGFNPFYGTSAAAPHAAAIAGLLLQHNSSHTYATMTTLLKGAVLDLAPTGWDVDSGNGIIMADTAVKKSINDSVTSVTLSPTSVAAGATSTATITLSKKAPPNGLSFTLKSSDTTMATVPATAKIAGGATTTTFTVTTKGTLAGSVTITATAATGIAKTAVLTVTAASTGPKVTAIAWSKATYTGGTALTGTLTLDKAPAANLVVKLVTNNTAVATVPVSVTVAAGATTKAFAVTTVPVTTNTSVVVTATPTGGAAFNKTLVVRAPYPISLTFTYAGVTGGVGNKATVTLSGPAPSAGAKVTVASDNVNAKVPAAVTVPASTTSTTIYVTTYPVVTTTTPKISVTANSITVSRTFTLRQPDVKSITLSVATVKGGTAVTATVTLTGKAPTGGVLIKMTSSDTTAATVPVQMTIPVGVVSKSFTVTTKKVAANKTTTISANTGTFAAKTATLTVTP